MADSLDQFDESEREAIMDLAQQVDDIEQICARQAEKNRTLALALYDQSSSPDQVPARTGQAQEHYGVCGRTAGLPVLPRGAPLVSGRPLMPGINTLLDIGNKSLLASQTAIQVTGQNIANVNTEGYHRRTLRLEEAMAINYRPGQLGTGVNATEVIRHFDRFVENTYNDKSAEMQRWQNMFKNLKGVEVPVQ